MEEKDFQRKKEEMFNEEPVMSPIPTYLLKKIYKHLDLTKLDNTDLVSLALALRLDLED